MRGRTSRQRKPCEKVSEAWPCSTWSGIRPGAWEAWARGPEPHLFCHPCLVSAETWPPGLWLQCPSPAPHLALSQASAMSSPLRALFLLALGLGLAGTLNPKDPNTCSFWESFTTTTKESHSRPFSLLPSEPCDRPWESPHTCPRPTVVYRTVYRQVVKTEHRMRLQCCQGFYESSGACVPLCARECVHGRCVAPNQCQCVQDWRGDDCSSACALGVWGPQCDKPCNCGNSSSCDPKSGACSCPSGLQPPHCFRPCSPGRYGPACQFSCQCHGAPCDPQTGACLCPPERTGPSCEVSCSQDSVGFFCPSTPPCQNGGVFQASRGSCSCPPGWMGTICSLPCPEGSYGPNCSQECRCHNGGLCDRFTGQCRCAPGYTGDRCREECPVGRFGQDCAETCDCATGARCFPANGACLCEHGFTGDRCAERLCPDGLYGLSCQMPCTCDPEHSLNCHPMSGECSCLPGWAGLHCNESCPQDTHGPGCQEHCLCLHGGVCQPDSGLCRCAPGYTGPHCASLCPPDTYGVNCSARCSCENAIACSPIDGTCVCKEEEATKTQKVVVHPLRSFNLLSNIQQFLCLSPMRPWAAPPPAPAHSAEPGRANAQCVLAQEGSQVPMPTCKSPLPGWQHGNCSVPCPPGTWGFGCNASCQCAHEAACSPQTGACTCTPGWHGTHCQFPCLKGMFGEGCASRCDCDHSDGCDPVHGHCQCQAGWTGTRCHLPCPEGFWGTNCSNTCTCKNGGTCIPENGNCVCAPGFRGPSCQRSCPLGHWGANCAQLCHCRHGGTCHPQHGSCFCPPGRTGHLCLEGCSPGVFGANCSQPCQCGPGERCHPETGACVCPPGHSGAPCRIGSQEPFTMMPTSPVAYNSLGAVIGIAVLGSLVVALVALFIGYRHWQKGKAHQHLAVAYSSGRLDGSEYVMPDVPPSYSHYYSNPSYHTLSQCSPNPPPPNKVPGSQLFASLQAPERPGGAHGHDNNHATLPADWKHRRQPPPGPLDRGRSLGPKASGNSRLDRSYSCSYSNRNGPGPFYSKGPISEEGLGASVASLSSENPYATIRDLPSLLGSPRESSYMEMKGPPSGSPPRQPPQLRDSQRRRHPQPERDSGTYEQPSPLTHDRDSVGSQPPLPPGLPPGHYDSPKNSHIPGHYDLPPVRHPPSPPLRRQDR
ncbi:platelet endothelial aggregation receptor 1 isoform X3 [Tursiops truncatus]|uniref:platelet endothelial aggregation receptor 1 isoform X3 n=1 Tax=Tursiops truncatus TaxID=9739 RepID=UPI003CCF0C10